LPETHVVPAGGLAFDQSSWIAAHKRFFLPVKVLGKVFRGKFVAGLRRAFSAGKLSFHGDLKALTGPKLFRAFVRSLYRCDWVVYSKKPFRGSEHVLQYLARYTHRVAISNHRLVSFDGHQVTFRWKDYAHGNKQKIMTLSADDFLRRFLHHVLPRSFVRIRFFGFLSASKRRDLLPVCRALVGALRSADINGASVVSRLFTCPRCGGAMILIQRLNAISLRLHTTQAMFNDSS
jgi:hypothetical protein